MSWLGDGHTFQAVHEEKLSSMLGRRPFLVHGVIAEKPKNRDAMEEDGSYAFSSICISTIGKGLPNERRSERMGRDRTQDAKKPGPKSICQVAREEKMGFVFL